MTDLPQITHKRACHLCEAICGLDIVTQGDQILSIKGDKDDPLSRGHICPKAIALQDLHEDPDRIKKPIKRVDGEWVEIPWEQAFSEIAERVAALQGEHGNDSLAVYAGNPNVHNYGNLTHGKLLRKALQTKSNFSATSLDQLPHHFVALYLFGHQFLVPVPDVDHTDYFLMFGANPVASNGSMMTVPDIKKRLKSIQERQGKVVVFDPRRSETADVADEHYFVRPSSDVYVLLAMLRYVLENKDTPTDLGVEVLGTEQLYDMLASFSIEKAAQQSGISADELKHVFDAFLNADKAVIYGRMGVSTQRYGTICQWAIHLINLYSGNLDKQGGAMFPSSAVGYVKPGEPGRGHYAKYHSRVSGLPEFGGELPSTVLAEEILTEGEGQYKALFTMAGNPVLSAPNGRQLDEAFSQLDLMVSLDFYLNETTRHADYILPPTGPLEHDHYDLAFLRLSVRDYARYSGAIFEKKEGYMHDWEILSGLAKAISIAKEIPFKPLIPPHLLIDMGLQMGPYGKAATQGLALSLDKLKSNPSGIDLGPLKSGLSSRICTEDKCIHVVIESLLPEIEALATREEGRDESCDSQTGFLLIGRRHIRSNNSWLHNSQRLVKGPRRDHALLNPSDTDSLGMAEGERIVVQSRVGKIEIDAFSSDEIMPGVISIPHGWGHDRKGTNLSVAQECAGVSVNDIVDDQYYDPLTGNAGLNGVPCSVHKL
ncbi:dehydrogenase [Oleiphilus sp. HI0009]|nr:molybdopterin-dependent oxidoreductase [Oleiphilus sp. HI0067]KZX78824.1 dehydrogenase [Oleiphilus sp. HI0009]KZY69303.1 dehydrogenase [Oleiphilus sp. HI0067]